MGSVLSDRVLGNLSCLYFGRLVDFSIIVTSGNCRGNERKITDRKYMTCFFLIK